MGFGNFAKGAASLPVIATGVDLLTNNPIGETVGNTIGAVGTVMEAGNSLLNPLFASVAGAASAGLLTNSILKESKWMEEHKKTRWLLSGAATVTGYVGGSAVTPYLVAGGLSYTIGKHGWKYGKEALKRGVGAAWGITGGLVKGAAVGGFNSVKAGFKGEQKKNPVI